MYAPESGRGAVCSGGGSGRLSSQRSPAHALLLARALGRLRLRLRLGLGDGGFGLRLRRGYLRLSRLVLREVRRVLDRLVEREALLLRVRLVAFLALGLLLRGLGRPEELRERALTHAGALACH